MTVIFVDGFESGVFVPPWTLINGAVAIINNPVHLGNYAAQATGAGSYLEKLLASSYGDLYVRFYVRFPSLPTTQYSYIRVLDMYASDWSTSVGLRYWYSDGIIKWCLQLPSGDRFIAATIQPNTWYCVEVRRAVGNGNGVVTLWVDGVQLLTATTETQTVNANRVMFGCNATDIATQVVIADDCVVADAPVGTGMPTVTRTLAYQSTPVSVPLTFDGQQLPSGQLAQVQDGSLVTVSVPQEVTG